uniref:Uncharacterized protein n=1 Tax=Knipowitschia caucasica TaxID=637954 RepID=A0AAV2L8R5_KNICA
MRPCAQSLCSLCSLLCLLLTPGALCDVLQPKAAEEVGPPRPPQILDLTRTQLQAVPHSPPNGSVWTLILNQNRISLDESDREALRSYRGLTHLYLEHNAVTEVTAGYFTQMPRLTLLSLCGNNISRYH